MAEKKDEDLGKKLTEAIKEFEQQSIHVQHQIEQLEDIHNRAHEAYISVIRDKKTGKLKHGILFNNPKKFDEAYKKLLESYVTNFAGSIGIDAKNVLDLLKTFKPGKHSQDHSALEELVYHASGKTATEWYNTLKDHADKKIAYTNSRHDDVVSDHVKAHTKRWRESSLNSLREYLKLEGSAAEVYKLIGEEPPKRGKGKHTEGDLIGRIDAYQSTPKGKTQFDKTVEDYYKAHVPKEKK